MFGKIEVTILPEETTLEDDLLRRDFRCNAVMMALDGTIHDVLGGREDISRRVLRPCASTILRDDPIRFFRALRFVSHGWSLSSEFTDLLSSSGVDTLEKVLTSIPVQRFTREMCTAMVGDLPWYFFSLMTKFNLGRCYIPELFRMREIPAGPFSHDEHNVLEHSLGTLRRISSTSRDPVARFAAFFHDIGKLATPGELLPRHPGHDRAGVHLARVLAERLKLPDRVRRGITAACKLHLLGRDWQQLRRSTRMNLAQGAFKAGIADFFPLLVAADQCVQDRLTGWELYLGLVQLSPTDLGMDAPALSSMSSAKRQSLIMQFRHRRLKLMEAAAENDLKGVTR